MLAAKFDAGEARAIERIIIEHCLNMSPVDAVIKADMQIPDFTENKATGMAERVRNGEPVQYVVGHARFCGFDFKGHTCRADSTPGNGPAGGYDHRPPFL